MKTDIKQAFSQAPRRWDILTMFIGTTLVAAVGIPIYGFLYDFHAAPWIAFGVIFAACNLSISVGYHRLWSHKTFQAHWSVRIVLAFVGALALQNSILKWASDHRRHHGNLDDTEKDPYCAKRGFWFSHIGWMLKDYPSALVDLSNVRDLQKDPIARWQHRRIVPLTIGMNLLVPTVLGLIFGQVLETFLLAGFLRIVVGHHITFFINSLAHMWGTQPWSTDNTARDNPVLAVLTFGEGYHNYHHAYPGDYRNGVRLWHWDPTKWIIRLLWLVGLTKNLRTPQKLQTKLIETSEGM